MNLGKWSGKSGGGRREKENKLSPLEEDLTLFLSSRETRVEARGSRPRLDIFGESPGNALPGLFYLERTGLTWVSATQAAMLAKRQIRNPSR